MSFAATENLVKTELTATLSAGAATANVTDASRFPAAPNFAVVYNATLYPDGIPVDITKIEIIQYTGKTGTTLTGLTRGQQGTSDQTWSTASATINVMWLPTRGLFEDIANHCFAGYSVSNRSIGSAAPSSPTVALHIKDAQDIPFVIESTDPGAGMQIQDTVRSWTVGTAGGHFYVRDASGGYNTCLHIGAGAPPASLYIDTDGDVGVGVAPASGYGFHVQTPNDWVALFESEDAVAGIQIKEPSQTWGIHSTSGNLSVRDVTGGNDDVFTIEAAAPATSLYIDSTGYVGIGTASPADPLHVYGSSVQMASLETTQDDIELTFRTAQTTGVEVSIGVDSDALFMKTGSGINFVMDTNGLVGVQNSSPSTRLHVGSSASSTAQIVRIESGVTGTSNIAAGLELYASGATAGEKRWQFAAFTDDGTDGRMFLRAMTDAGAVHKNILEITHDGYVCISLLNSDPGSVLLDNETYMAWLDEVSSPTRLYFKVRTSAGTFKQGYVEVS